MQMVIKTLRMMPVGEPHSTVRYLEGIDYPSPVDTIYSAIGPFQYSGFPL